MISKGNAFGLGRLGRETTPRKKLLLPNRAVYLLNNGVAMGRAIAHGYF
jgi:hypothetical protein